MEDTMVRIAIVYYSSTGNTYQVARAAEDGAKKAGADTRLRRVRELAPPQAIASNPAWQEHYAASKDIPEATLDDLDWADGYLFGTPTRFGNVAAQLKQFLDSAGPLWAQGKLANKVVAAFTGAGNVHGGQESTLLALYNTMYHWGVAIVPAGYTDPVIFGAGGNPYGVSFTAAPDGQVPAETLAAARYLGARLTRFAALIAQNRDQLSPALTEAELVEERREELGIGTQGE
jgi:NAD(P)H dehydrogenase (quinone)